MSVLIRGMDMPESCWDCPCCNGENGYCQLRKEYVYGDIPRSCPLIPVPEHGDLIDRDETVKTLAHDYAYAAADMVRDEMPTIIPASKEEQT